MNVFRETIGSQAAYGANLLSRNNFRLAVLTGSLISRHQPDTIQALGNAVSANKLHLPHEPSLFVMSGANLRKARPWRRSDDAKVHVSRGRMRRAEKHDLAVWKFFGASLRIQSAARVHVRSRAPMSVKDRVIHQR